MDCSLPGSSVHGISQARILEWVTISGPGNPPDPGIEPVSPALSGGFFTPLPPEKPVEHLAQHYFRVCTLNGGILLPVFPFGRHVSITLGFGKGLSCLHSFDQHTRL